MNDITELYLRVIRVEEQLVRQGKLIAMILEALSETHNVQTPPNHDTEGYI